MVTIAGISLLHGWFPLAVECLAGMGLLAVAVSALRPPCRPGRLIGAVVGPGLVLPAVLAGWAREQGLMTDPPPAGLWLWLGAATAAFCMAIVNRARARRGWVRSLLATAAALLAAGSQLNQSIGYLPTLGDAWGQVTAAPLPDQLPAGPTGPANGALPASGRLVEVTTPADVSHFGHRDEYVYLPPALLVGQHPPVPVVLMIGAEFSGPTEWIRIGEAVHTADAYAHSHQGLAPILVFPDATGSFSNDTECVDGPRGNAATHLIDEVRPYVLEHFAAAPEPRRWAVVGWSTGGTCALDLAVMHPELFGTFEDIEGDLAPNAGDAHQTLTRLYGGDPRAMSRFDPVTAMLRHIHYPDTAGWFVDPTPAATGPGRPGRPVPAAAPNQQALEARRLCDTASTRAIACAVHLQPGGHTWQFAAAAFAAALPWLVDRLTPSTAVASTPQPAR